MNDAAEPIMTPDEFKRRMEEAFSSRDTEHDHYLGDQLMCQVLRQLGYGDGVKVFDDEDKWYV